MASFQRTAAVLICLSLWGNQGWAQETMDPPPPAVSNDADAPNTAVGEKGDVGNADPLTSMETPPGSTPVAPAPSAAETPPPPEIAPTSPPPAETVAEPAPLEQAPPAPVEEPPAPAETAQSRGADDPDFKKEERFHRIYKSFNEKPTSDEAWEQASAQRKAEVYKVQKGDTLWGLSQTLFGDANYWPKIWSLNDDEIYNPHEIDTWMGVRFFPGSLAEPPTVAVSSAAPIPVEPAAGSEMAEAPKVADVSESSLIPPPKKRARLVKTLPPSMPLYRLGNVNVPPVTFETPHWPVLPKRPAAAMAFDLAEGESSAIGTIKETELGGVTASEYQYVFVDIEGSSERIFTVLKEIGRIQDPKMAGREVRMLEIQGEIEVIEPVSEKARLHRAIVRKTIAPVEVGAKLVPGRIQNVATEELPVTSGPAVKIIGGRFSNTRQLIEAESFVYLDGGATAGLQAGQSLGVFSSVRLRNPESAADQNDRRVGSVRILKVTNHFAIGFVTAAADDIRVGDQVGGGVSVGGASLPPSGVETSSSSGSSEADLDFEANDGPSGSGDPVVPAEEAPSSDAGPGGDELSL